MTWQRRHRSDPALPQGSWAPLAALLASLLLALASVGPAPTLADDLAEPPKVLQATARHRQVARLVTRFVERYHYARPRVDDELSELVLDGYLKALDPGKQYFLESDIVYFSRYRHTLDDVLRSGQLDPIFDIFRLYRLRAQQNLGYALSLLDHEPDFTADEIYYFDRDDLPWIATATEMQDTWRRRVKNDALNLMLADKSWADAAGVLRKRYSRVLKRINEVDSDDVFETFMNAFAHTLDPHSSYLSPRQAEEYRIQMSLSYEGIGASLQLDDDFVKILDVIPGGPAAIDGRLKANDRITAVGQGDSQEMTDVVGWELDDVVQLIRGPGGTRVRLQILPADALPGSDQYIVELVRDKVKLEAKAAKADTMEVERDGETLRIGVIDVPSFYQDYDARSRGEEDYTSTTRDVARLLKELQAEGIDGLIVDLRGNGGGHLTEATALTGLFIDHGPIVQVKDVNGRIDVLEDPSPTAVYDGPLIVLVDRFSASASEIFAAAIQDYQRGLIIGQQTFGKGTVQNLYVLDQWVQRAPEEGLGQLTLTIGKYYRVTGGSTQHRGVLPDISLPSPIDARSVGESNRERALPWDQISATRYSVQPPLPVSVQDLSEWERARMETDPNVRNLRLDIAALEEARAKKWVSLNLEQRRSEREQRRSEQLARENARRQALGMDTLDSLEQLDDGERPDVLRQQAANVLADILENKARSRPVLTQASDS